MVVLLCLLTGALTAGITWYVAWNAGFEKGYLDGMTHAVARLLRLSALARVRAKGEE